MDKKEEKEISTKTGDIYLAAALLSYGFDLVNVDRENIRRQVFSFSGCCPIMVMFEGEQIKSIKNPNLDQITNSFFAKTLWLPPSYPDDIRKLKASLYTQKE